MINYEKMQKSKPRRLQSKMRNNTLYLSCRGQDRHLANGPATVVERGGSGETHPVDEADSQPQHFYKPRLTEGNQILTGLTMSQNPHGDRTVSNSSSGYFSSDSVPSSPLTPCCRPDKSTQTPSPSSQAIIHAVQRLSQTQHSSSSHGKHPLADGSLACTCEVYSVSVPNQKSTHLPLSIW